MGNFRGTCHLKETCVHGLFRCIMGNVSTYFMSVCMPNIHHWGCGTFWWMKVATYQNFPQWFRNQSPSPSYYNKVILTITVKSNTAWHADCYVHHFACLFSRELPPCPLCDFPARYLEDFKLIATAHAGRLSAAIANVTHGWRYRIVVFGFNMRKVRGGAQGGWIRVRLIMMSWSLRH